MRSASVLLALLPLLVCSTDVPAGTSQTIVPFSQLPLCAQSCGPLFDAQGACGQTALTATSQSCFCSYSTLAGFKTGTAGVCDSAGCTAAELTSIKQWFSTYCASTSTGAATTTVAGSGSAATTAANSGNSGSSGSSSSSGGNTWISTHYQYVIMIIIIVLGLGVLWAGAIFLRKRHIAKRDRAYELRPPHAAWGPSASHPLGLPNMSQTSFMSGENHTRSSSPLPQMYYAGKGRSPLSREVAAQGAPSVTNLEGAAAAKKSDPFGGKRVSKSKLNKWTPGDRT